MNCQKREKSAKKVYKDYPSQLSVVLRQINQLAEKINVQKEAFLRNPDVAFKANPVGCSDAKKAKAYIRSISDLIEKETALGVREEAINTKIMKEPKRKKGIWKQIGWLTAALGLGGVLSFGFFGGKGKTVSAAPNETDVAPANRVENVQGIDQKKKPAPRLVDDMPTESQTRKWVETPPPPTPPSRPAPPPAVGSPGNDGRVSGGNPPPPTKVSSAENNGGEVVSKPVSIKEECGSALEEAKAELKYTQVKNQIHQEGLKKVVNTARANAEVASLNRSANRDTKGMAVDDAWGDASISQAEYEEKHYAEEKSNVPFYGAAKKTGAIKQTAANI